MKSQMFFAFASSGTKWNDISDKFLLNLNPTNPSKEGNTDSENATKVCNEDNG